jgi:amino-acid racemase
MEQAFCKDRLRDMHGLEVIVPPVDGREAPYRIIFAELCLGRTIETSRTALRGIIARLADEGADSMI